MPPPEPLPPDPSLPDWIVQPESPGAYTLRPLAALDGVLIHVTRHGEVVGSYFGKTELAAAAAVAREVFDVDSNSESEDTE